MDFKNIIREIPNFPIEGVLFRDITPVLKDGQALSEAVDNIADVLNLFEFDYIVAPESRGFIFAMPLAYKLKKGFIPIRKEGKLPAEKISKTYELEYGNSTIEIHKDAIKEGDKIVIVDDLLATGGTTKAIAELIEQLGGKIVNMTFFIELENLNGRKLLSNYDIKSIIKY